MSYYLNTLLPFGDIQNYVYAPPTNEIILESFSLWRQHLCKLY